MHLMAIMTTPHFLVDFRDERYVMAHQQHQLSLLQRLMPSAKKVPGGVKGRVSMTLQDGATTTDILTGILQVHTSTSAGSA